MEDLTATLTTSAGTNGNRTSEAASAGSLRSAVAEATAVLQDTTALLDGLSAASPLTAGTAAAFVAIIDAVSMASKELAAASDSNASTLNASDTAGAASVEETTKAAADAMATVLDGIGSGLAAGLGEGEATSLQGDTFVLSVQRTSTDGATSADAAAASLATDKARTAPAAALVTTSLRRRLASSYTVPAALTSEAARGAPPVFLVSSAMSALEAVNEVSIKTVEVTASNTLRQPPAPSGTEVPLLASSVASLALLDSKGSNLIVTNSSEPILLVISTTLANLTLSDSAEGSSSANASSDDCRTYVDAADVCEAEAAALEAAVTAKEAECNDLPSTMVGEKAAAISACSQELQALWDEHTAKAVECGAIALPCNGGSRGECSLDDGVCKCVDGWMGITCEQRPQCVYVDPAGDWSGDACELVSVTEQGDDVFAVVCACTSAPHEYAVLTTVVKAADAFFTAVTTMRVTLPGPLGWEDLVSTLEGSVSTSVPAIVLSVLALLAGLLFAVRYDKQQAYTRLYPTWHECLSCEASQSAAWRAVGASVVYVLSHHHFCFVFLALPMLPATKAQRLMTLYNVVLVQLAVLILFWGSTNSGAAAAWAQLIDIVTVLLVKNLLVWLFMRGVLCEADYDTETAKAASAHLHAAEHTQWHLMMRQTVPKRSAPPSAMQRYAAAWRGDGPLLLGGDEKAPNYYDALAARRDLDLYRDAAGRLTFKIVTYHRAPTRNQSKADAGGAPVARRRGATKHVTTWRQLNGLDEWRVRGLEVLYLSNDESAQVFSGLHRSGAPRGSFSSGEPMPYARLSGKSEESGQGLYELGEPRLNEMGGITTWATTAEASAYRVELFLLNPHYRPFHHLLPQHHLEIPHFLKRLHRKHHLPKALMVKMGPKTTRLAERLGWGGANPGHGATARPKPKLVRALSMDILRNEKKEVAIDEELLRRSHKGRQSSNQGGGKAGGEGMAARPAINPASPQRSFAASAFLVHKLANVPECALVRQADGSAGFFVRYSSFRLSKVISSANAGIARWGGMDATEEEQIARLKRRFDQEKEALTKRAQQEVMALQEGAEQGLEKLDATAVEVRREHMWGAVRQVQRRLATALHQLEEDNKYELAELKHAHHRERRSVPELPHYHHLHYQDHRRKSEATKGDGPVGKPAPRVQKSDEPPSEGESDGTDEQEEDALQKHVVKAEQKAISRWVRLGDELRELQHIKARASAAALRAADALSVPAHETHARYVEEVEEVNALRSTWQAVIHKKHREGGSSQLDVVSNLQMMPLVPGTDQHDEGGDEPPMPLTAEGVGAWWEDLSEVQRQAVALRHLQALDTRLEAAEAAQQGAMARLEERATQRLGLIQAEYEADVARLKAAFAQGGSRIMAPKPRPQWVKGLLLQNGSVDPPPQSKAGVQASDESAGQQERSEASWPHFIPVLTVRRMRPLPGSHSRSEAADDDLKRRRQSSEPIYEVTYKDDAADNRKITADQLVLTPMEVHRRLAMQYQKRRVEGWPHEDAMAELNQHCGLPVVWRGCRPFTGGFDLRRLLLGWALSWCVFVLSLALLMYDWLSQRDEIPFGSVFGTFALSALVLPIVEMMLQLVSRLLMGGACGRAGRGTPRLESESGGVVACSIAPTTAPSLPPPQQPPTATTTTVVTGVSPAASTATIAATGDDAAASCITSVTDVDAAIDAAAATSQWRVEAAAAKTPASAGSDGGSFGTVTIAPSEPPSEPHELHPHQKSIVAAMAALDRNDDDYLAAAAAAAAEYPPVAETVSPTESSDEPYGDEEAAMVSEGMRALAGSFVRPSATSAAVARSGAPPTATTTLVVHDARSVPRGSHSAQAEAAASWLMSSTSSPRQEAALRTEPVRPSPALRQAPPRSMPPPDSAGAHDVNAGAAVLRSRQATQARRASPAESAAVVLLAAQGVPLPPSPQPAAPRPGPAAPAQLEYAQPPAAPYRPRGAGAAARRQLRVAAGGGARSSAARRASGSGGGVRGHTMASRAALRHASGPLARPPPRSPPPRDRNTIDLGDLRSLEDAPRASYEGGYDPRLEAHRWLRSVLGTSGGSADALGIEVAVAVHQEASPGRQKRQTM